MLLVLRKLFVILSIILIFTSCSDSSSSKKDSSGGSSGSGSDPSGGSSGSGSDPDANVDPDTGKDSGPGPLPPSPPPSGDSKCKNFVDKLFGDRVCIFKPGQSNSSIQSVIDAIHNDYKNDDHQFVSNGYALLFQPSDYTKDTGVKARIGYYTQLLGLAKNPENTILSGVIVDNQDLVGNTSLQNFWRGAENFKVNEGNTWAVSQAAPLRRAHIAGELVLALGDDHYASGGFLANTLVDNTIEPRGQQQWITRNSKTGSWKGGVWNMIFLGVEGTITTNKDEPIDSSTIRYSGNDVKIGISSQCLMLKRLLEFKKNHILYMMMQRKNTKSLFLN